MEIMMKNNKKGAAIIIAIMVVLILTIMSFGFLFVTNQSTFLAQNNLDETKLFWAADAGANQALRWIRRLNVGDFTFNDLAPAARDHYNSTDNLKKFTINNDGQDITVETSLGYAGGKWNITSEAYKGTTKSGKICEITLVDIKGSSMSRYALGFTGNMTAGTRWVGDVIDGTVYAGGYINVGLRNNSTQDARFKKTVSFANDCGNSYAVKYSNLDPNATNYEENNLGFDKYERFTTGLQELSNKDKGIRVDNYDLGTNSDINKNNFKDRINAIFPLTDKVDKIDPAKGVTYSWSEFTNTVATPIENISVFNLQTDPATSALFATGTKFKIKLDGTTAKVMHGNTEVKSVNLSSTNTIIIPEMTTTDNILASYNYIEVEGSASTNACIVTERNDIVVTGSISKTGANTSISILAGLGSTGTGDNQVFKKGDILVNSSSDVTIDAALFSPGGVFGRYGIQGDANCTDELAWENAGISEGKRISVTINGSIAMMKKGYFSRGYQAMNAYFNNNPDWLDGTVKPIGYVPSVGTDGSSQLVNVISEGYTWKVVWKSL